MRPYIYSPLLQSRESERDACLSEACAARKRGGDVSLGDMCVLAYMQQPVALSLTPSGPFRAACWSRRYIDADLTRV